MLACRYGGDEFCVILPGTNAETAAAIAERLRASVETGGSAEHGITVSIGYASLAQAGEQFTSAEKLFDAADAALYTAKQAGRNRVAAFNGRRKEDPSPEAALRHSGS